VGPIDRLEQLSRELGQLTRVRLGYAVHSGRCARGIEQNGRSDVGRELTETLGGPFGGQHRSHG
jgi:hypothetical protein